MSSSDLAITIGIGVFVSFVVGVTWNWMLRWYEDWLHRLLD